MNIFIISSAINSHVFSVFNTSDRYLQTLNTIESIKKYIPNNYIILFDTTILNQNIRNNLINNVHLFIDLSINNEALQYASQDKSLGECYGTIFVLKYIINRSLQYSRIFKISGRYSINHNFNINDYQLDSYNFKTKNEHQIVFLTTLYSINDANKYLYHMNLVFQLIQDKKAINIESALSDVLLNYKYVNYVPILGISGKIAANGHDYSD